MTNAIGIYTNDNRFRSKVIKLVIIVRTRDTNISVILYKIATRYALLLVESHLQLTSVVFIGQQNFASHKT